MYQSSDKTNTSFLARSVQFYETDSALLTEIGSFSLIFCHEKDILPKVE